MHFLLLGSLVAYWIHPSILLQAFEIDTSPSICYQIIFTKNKDLLHNYWTMQLFWRISQYQRGPWVLVSLVRYTWEWMVSLRPLVSLLHYTWGYRWSPWYNKPLRTLVSPVPILRLRMVSLRALASLVYYTWGYEWSPWGPWSPSCTTPEVMNGLPQGFGSAFFLRIRIRAKIFMRIRIRILGVSGGGGWG